MSGGRVRLVPLVVAAWAGAACNTLPPPTLDGTRPPLLPGAQPPAEMSPVLNAVDVTGLPVDERAVAGKVVLVDFFASWCVPCQYSIPFYRRLHQRFERKGLVVVGVNVDDNRDALTRYMASHPLPFRVVWDQDKALSGRFSVMQLPTSFLFDRRGRLRKTRYGFEPEEVRQVEDEVRLLLDEDR